MLVRNRHGPTSKSGAGSVTVHSANRPDSVHLTGDLSGCSNQGARPHVKLPDRHRCRQRSDRGAVTPSIAANRQASGANAKTAQAATIAPAATAHRPEAINDVRLTIASCTAPHLRGELEDRPSVLAGPREGHGLPVDVEHVCRPPVALVGGAVGVGRAGQEDLEGVALLACRAVHGRVVEDGSVDLGQTRDVVLVADRAPVRARDRGCDLGG
jgi:hypothetical protein